MSRKMKDDVSLLIVGLIALHTSKNDPITQADLEKKLEVGQSEIRGYIHDLRLTGYPICSNNKGYWYSINPADIDETIKILEDKRSTITETIRALDRIKERK